MSGRSRAGGRLQVREDEQCPETLSGNFVRKQCLGALFGGGHCALQLFALVSESKEFLLPPLHINKRAHALCFISDVKIGH